MGQYPQRVMFSFQPTTVYMDVEGNYMDVEGNKGIGIDPIPNPIQYVVCSSMGINIVGNIISAAKRCNYPGRRRVTRLVTS